MRILHTADWHLGKMLQSVDRLKEQEAFIDEIYGICKDEEIDLVLIAGDIYQSVNPSAAAEELFYDAVDRLAEHGRRGVVIIAGNHDNPDRLCAPSPLADKLGITLVGFPCDEIKVSSIRKSAEFVRRINAGQNWLELTVPGCDHSAVIAALPYPSEGRLGELLAKEVNEESIMRGYNERIAGIFNLLNGHFRRDTVNLAMSHLYVNGGVECMSEQKIQSVGGAYAVSPAAFPAQAQYTALGHLHRPQNIKGAPMPVRYAGSPLAYSFSEVGYSKSVTLIEVRPGETAMVKEIPLKAGKPLVCWSADQGYEQAVKWLEEGRDPNAWIDLEIYLTQPLSLKQIQTLRKLRPGIVEIHPFYVEQEHSEERENCRQKFAIDELFVRFFERQNGGAQPNPELVKLFMELTNHEENKLQEEVGE